MRFAVLQFPGTTADEETVGALRQVAGLEATRVWHDSSSLAGFDAVVLPGGFSYGDHLRCGALAALSPIMEAVRGFAGAGGLVLGIGNGFQILCEAGLLPGALIRNPSLHFRCERVFLHTTTRRSPFTRAVPGGKVLRMPIAHGAGCYHADTDTLAALRAKDQILWEYTTASGNPTEAANPNGSAQNIAGICNIRRNVAGLMPRPERACESNLGSEDGRFLWQSMLAYLRDHEAAKAT